MTVSGTTYIVIRPNTHDREVQQRQEIQDTVNNNGATYHGDLTKAVTHLIVATPSGAKYQRARQWGMKLVSVRWFQDSLTRGMTLEESLYDPLIPEIEQGKGAFIRGFKRTTSLGKRARESGSAGPGEDAGKRKMRRTASARLGSHSQNLWADISQHDGDSATLDADQWTEDPSAVEPEPTMPLDLPPAIRRSRSLRDDSVKMDSPLPDHQQAPTGLFAGWACHPMGHTNRIVCRHPQ